MGRGGANKPFLLPPSSSAASSESNTASAACVGRGVPLDAGVRVVRVKRKLETGGQGGKRNGITDFAGRRSSERDVHVA